MAVLLVPTVHPQPVLSMVADSDGGSVIAQHEPHHPDRILCINHVPVAG